MYIGIYTWVPLFISFDGDVKADNEIFRPLAIKKKVSSQYLLG